MNVSVRTLVGSGVPWSVLASAALFAGLGLAFVGLALLREEPVNLVLPGVAAALGVLVAVGLLLRRAAARVGGQVVLALLALLHVVIAAGAARWWVQLFSVCAVVGYVAAGVLLGTREARRYFDGSPRP